MVRVALRVLGGGGEVGRLSVLARLEGRREGVLLDAGVGFDEEDRPIFAATYPPKYVEAIVLSHAHLDHIGTAPMYYISGNPVLYATRPTAEMAKLMWEDFLKLNGYYSTYEHVEVERALQAVRYVKPGGFAEAAGFKLRFYHGGHIPGSILTVLEADGARVAFTGDINTIRTKLMEPADLDSVGKVDLLITEATYGAATHPPRERSEERLISIVEEVVLDKGGTVLIPAFSIARGQEVMIILAMRDLGVPVAVDGMVRNVTEIFVNNPEFVRNADVLAKAMDMFQFVRGWRDRNRVWKKPGVIIASAGMLKGGPSLYYLKKLGDDPKNAVVLVSFQAPGSPGRRLVEEGKMPDSEEPLRARLEWLDFSSHADRRGLLEVIRKLKPSRVLVVHSEPDVAAKFAEYVRERAPFVEDITIAENGAEYTYEF